MKVIGFNSVLCQLVLAVCVGCNGSGTTVQGTVTIDGQLARQGTVQFHPLDGGPTAYGTVSDNGSYALRVGQGDLNDPNAGEVPLGEYVVTAVVNSPSVRDETESEAHPPVPGARLTAEKYASKDTSDLRVTIAPGANIVPLELKSADDEDLDSFSAEGLEETEDSDAEGEPRQEASTTSEEEPAIDEPSEGEQEKSSQEQVQ